MDRNDNNESLDTWSEYQKMIAHLETKQSLSQSTRRFIESLKGYHATFGYLTDKQRYSLKATFDIYSDSN